MREEGHRGGSEEVQARAASGFDDRRNVILRISSPCREHSSMTSAESRKEIYERVDWEEERGFFRSTGCRSTPDPPKSLMQFAVIEYKKRAVYALLF